MVEVINQSNVNLKLDPNCIVKIDRSSILGNPFKMSPFKNQESERKRVCEKYGRYFDEIIQRYISNQKLSKFDKAFITELYRIYLLSKDTTIYLACWCFPKKCHGYTIMDFINMRADVIFKEGLKLTQIN